MTTRDSRRSILSRLTLRRGRIGDRGDSTVEVAILALPMMLVTGMLLHGGFYYYARSAALGAATQGASTARTYNLADRGAGDAKAREFLDAINAGLTNVQVTHQVTATTVTVTVSGDVYTFIPIYSTRITMSATRPIERVTTP